MPFYLIQIKLIPEQDSFLKVTVREAFGVNTRIQLCAEDGSKCNQESLQVGTAELLRAQVKKKQKYLLRFDYSDSVVAFHSFKECPHVVVEVSMISVEEYKILSKMLTETAPDTADSHARLSLLFNEFSNNG
jgi:hypothetical protein